PHMHITTSFLLLPPSHIIFPFLFFHSPAHHRDLHSFPTRRSSDLRWRPLHDARAVGAVEPAHGRVPRFRVAAEARRRAARQGHQDRKSTRLNSSHRTISYAVFCLKKKKKKKQEEKKYQHQRDQLET